MSEPVIQGHAEFHPYIQGIPNQQGKGMGQGRDDDVGLKDGKMAESKVKVIKIRVKYDDGSIREAVGDAAAKIMKHWCDCEFFASLHSWPPWTGPCLKEVKQKASEMVLTAEEVAAIRKHKGRRPSKAFVKAKLRAIKAGRCKR